MSDDAEVFWFVFAVVRILEHVVVVAVVVDVLVLGYQMNVEDADIDAQSWLAVPVEVGRLRHVRHVVGGLEVTRVVKIFEHHVLRCNHLHICLCSRRRAVNILSPYNNSYL